MFSTSKIRCKKVKHFTCHTKTTLLDQTAVFLFLFSPVVAVQNTTPEELGSDLWTRHLLQVGRSAERRLHSYVDLNSSGCYSVYEPARGTTLLPVFLKTPCTPYTVTSCSYYRINCCTVLKLLCTNSNINPDYGDTHCSLVRCHAMHQSRSRMASTVQLTHICRKACSWRDVDFVYSNAVCQ